MTKEEFDNIPFIERGAFCLTEGEYIGVLDSDGFTVILYAIEGLFVEIFHSQTLDKATSIEVVEDVNRLHLYSKEIDLGQII